MELEFFKGIWSSFLIGTLQLFRKLISFLFFLGLGMLLNSDYHQNVESHLLNRSFVFGSTQEVSQMKDEDFSQNLSLDSSKASVHSHTCNFFVLHLVYEELKLNT